MDKFREFIDRCLSGDGQDEIHQVSDLYRNLLEMNYGRTWNNHIPLRVPDSMRDVTAFGDYNKIMKLVPTANGTSAPDYIGQNQYPASMPGPTRDTLAETKSMFAKPTVYPGPGKNAWVTHNKPTAVASPDCSTKDLINKSHAHQPHNTEMTVASWNSEPMHGFSIKAGFSGPCGATINGVDAGSAGGGGSTTGGGAPSQS